MPAMPLDASVIAKCPISFGDGLASHRRRRSSLWVLSPLDGSRVGLHTRAPSKSLLLISCTALAMVKVWFHIACSAVYGSGASRLIALRSARISPIVALSRVVPFEWVYIPAIVLLFTPLGHGEISTLMLKPMIFREGGGNQV